MPQRGLTKELLACKIVVDAVAADFQRCSPLPPHSHHCQSQTLILSPNFQMSSAHHLLLPHHCCRKDAAEVEYGCGLDAS